MSPYDNNGVWRNKPLVVHYWWSNEHYPKGLIACGKRDIFDELLTTTKHSEVTCLRCQQTQRFKGPKDAEAQASAKRFPGSDFVVLGTEEGPA